MQSKEGVRARAQKMLALQKIERALVESGDEGFTIQIARAAMPLPAEIDKLCASYGRTSKRAGLLIEPGPKAPKTLSGIEI